MMLDKYQEMISYREANLLAFIQEPKSLDEIAAHQFIYRPGTGGVMVDQIERRSMTMHLERLLALGHVTQQQDDSWRAIS